MNLIHLLGEWSIPEAGSIRPIMEGDNNLTWLIDTPTDRYVLRAYRSDRLLEQIRYELRVLNILQTKDLSFRIPVPVPTVTGDLFASMSGKVFTLSAWLSGSPPQNDHLEQAYAAGQALAELGKVLADVQVEVTPTVAPFPPSGEFETWAGDSIDPAQILGELPIPKEMQNRSLALLEEAQARARGLYKTLPQQVIHRDYDPSNILMNGSSVNAVLDFEFCGHDLRILDLAYALSKWPEGFWHTGKEWEIIDSFARGYVRRQKLPLEELESLPSVLRLRAACSLFYRFGRYARGIENVESIVARIQETITDQIWLQINTQELLHHIRSWHR